MFHAILGKIVCTGFNFFLLRSQSFGVTERMQAVFQNQKIHCQRKQCSYQNVSLSLQRLAFCRSTRYNNVEIEMKRE